MLTASLLLCAVLLPDVLRCTLHNPLDLRNQSILSRGDFFRRRRSSTNNDVLGVNQPALHGRHSLWRDLHVGVVGGEVGRRQLLTIVRLSGAMSAIVMMRVDGGVGLHVGWRRRVNRWVEAIQTVSVKGMINEPEE